MKRYLLKMVLTWCSILLINTLSKAQLGSSVTGLVEIGPGTVTVSNDVVITGTLRIQPGTTLEFQGTYKMEVRNDGTIEANGTSGAPIIFTSANGTGGDPIGWRGIYFNGANREPDPQSSFQHCTFEYSYANGQGDDPLDEEMGGAIYLKYHDNVSFTDCRFENNKANSSGGALTANYSKIDFLRCVFVNNELIADWQAGGAIRCTNNVGEALIRHCSFYNNTTYTGGAIMFENVSGVRIEGCVFANNAANYGAAITLGGGASDVELYCNTIVNNRALSNDGGIITSTTAMDGFNFCNNIVYGNTDSGSGTVALSLNNLMTNVSLTYNLIQNGAAGISGLPGTATVTNTTDADPLFESASGGAGLSYNGESGDWSITNGSPCINAGMPGAVQALSLLSTDVLGNLREQQAVIDLGAYESSFVSTGVKDHFVNNQSRVYFNSVTKCIHFTRWSGRLKCSVYNQIGQLVKQQVIGEDAVMPVNDLSDGLYILKVENTDGNGSRILKIVVN